MIPGSLKVKVNIHRFRDKTKNQWEDRKTFIKVVGKYDLLEMDYSAVSHSPLPSPHRPHVV